MKVTLIGSGNLATNLGKAIIKSGHTVVQVFSRTTGNAELLANQLNAIPTTNLDDLSDETDVFILSGKDSVLKEIVDAISPAHPNKVIVHTAGSVGIEIFEGNAMHYGVIYPMQTFSKGYEVCFNKIPVFIEYNDPVSQVLVNELAKSLSSSVVELTSQDRKYLHLAAVFSCNFVNHCYALAAHIMESHGMTFDMLLPLIDETARKVHNIHPLKAQTGPAIRYDENIINKHLSLLTDSPDLANIYESMSKSIHKTSIDND